MFKVITVREGGEGGLQLNETYFLSACLCIVNKHGFGKR